MIFNPKIVSFISVLFGHAFILFVHKSVLSGSGEAAPFGNFQREIDTIRLCFLCSIFMHIYAHIYFIYAHWLIFLLQMNNF